MVNNNRLSHLAPFIYHKQDINYILDQNNLDNCNDTQNDLKHTIILGQVYRYTLKDNYIN